MIAEIQGSAAAILASVIIGAFLVGGVLSPLLFSSSFRKSFVPHIKANWAHILATVGLVVVSLLALSARVEIEGSLGEQLMFRGVTAAAFLIVIALATAQLRRRHPEIWDEVAQRGIAALGPKGRQVLLGWSVSLGLLLVALAVVLVVVFDQSG